MTLLAGRRLRVFALTALVAMAVSRHAAADGGRPSVWQHYEDPKLGAELRYPPLWTVEVGTGGYVAFTSPSGAVSISFDLFQPPRAATYRDFDRWARDMLKRLRRVTVAGKLLEQKRLRTGALSVFSWKVEERSYRGEMVIGMQAWFAVPYADPKERGGLVYALLVQVPKAHPEAAETQRVFDRMVKSVTMRPVE